MKFSEDEFFIRVWVHQCYTSQLLEVKQSFTCNLLGTTSLNYRYVRPTHTHKHTHIHTHTASETLRVYDLFRFLILLKQFEFLMNAFPPTLSFIRQRLVNHTIANISVIDRNTSEYCCNLDHNCASVNC